MKRPEEITTTSLLARAERTLLSNGYTRVRALLGEFPDSIARIFEDKYGIVAVVVFETWNDLSNRWRQAQDFLVSLMTKAVRKSEAKAWEGYLVLLTSGIAGVERLPEAQAIRYDTLRVRKLVASADDLQELSTVERVLLPVLPLRITTESERSESSVLDLLPESLSAKGIPIDATQTVIQALKDGRPLVTALYEHFLGK